MLLVCLDNQLLNKPKKRNDKLFNEDLQMQRKSREANKKIQEHRKKLLDAIGGDAYNGVDLFEGTEPMHAQEPQQGHADLGNPSDAGVDISSI